MSKPTKKSDNNNLEQLFEFGFMPMPGEKLKETEKTIHINEIKPLNFFKDEDDVAFIYVTMQNIKNKLHTNQKLTSTEKHDLEKYQNYLQKCLNNVPNSILSHTTPEQPNIFLRTIAKTPWFSHVNATGSDIIEQITGEPVDKKWANIFSAISTVAIATLPVIFQRDPKYLFSVGCAIPEELLFSAIKRGKPIPHENSYRDAFRLALFIALILLFVGADFPALMLAVGCYLFGRTMQTLGETFFGNRAINSSSMPRSKITLLSTFTFLLGYMTYERILHPFIVSAITSDSTPSSTPSQILTNSTGINSL
jgi:hypothetical protein